MDNSQTRRADGKRQIVDILVKGLIRAVDSCQKSSDISKLSENKYAKNITYKVDITQDKSVYVTNESNRN